MNNKILLLAITIFIIPLCACNPSPDMVTVTRVIDGDTIEIGTGQKVRYIGIDTPEVYPETEPYGIEAWEANSRLVEGLYRRCIDKCRTRKTGNGQGQGIPARYPVSGAA